AVKCTTVGWGGLLSFKAAHPLPPNPGAPPPHHKACPPAGGPAPPANKAEALDAANSAGSAKTHDLNIPAALSSHLVAHLSNAVLHFAGIKSRHLIASHRTGNSNGLIAAFSRQARIRQSRAGE